MSSFDLPETLAAITPTLEEAIHDDPEGFYGKVDTDLMLRTPHCGIASKSIQIFLAEKYGVTSQVVENIKVPIRFVHAVLLADNTIVDPTYGQFMETVGLSHQVASSHNLKHLYPHPPIATFATTDCGQFADTFTDHMVAVRPEIPLSHRDYPMRHFPPERLRMLFRSLWNIDHYTPHAYPADHFQRITRRVADRLLDTV